MNMSPVTKAEFDEVMARLSMNIEGKDFEVIDGWVKQLEYLIEQLKQS